jgi:hypothetical protein
MGLLSAAPKLGGRGVRSDDSTDAMRMLKRTSVSIAIGVVEIIFDLT